MTMRRLLFATAVISFPSVGHAVQPPADQPAPLSQLLDCRMITSADARLACYDRHASTISGALGSGELVAKDRRQIEEERRLQFGSNGRVANAADERTDTPEINEINGTLKNASQNAAGKWILELEDGARWAQIDSRSLRAFPRAGQPILIKRALMGSYLANVNGQIAIRVRRVN